MSRDLTTSNLGLSHVAVAEVGYPQHSAVSKEKLALLHQSDVFAKAARPHSIVWSS